MEIVVVEDNAERGDDNGEQMSGRVDQESRKGEVG